MKLRNKKTGESGKLTYLNFEIDIDEKETDLTILLDNTDGKCIDRQFYSLDELKKYLDEWEDYKPKEPLIKDEKIRKAVRAWAEANGLDYANCYGSAHAWYLRAFNSREQAIDIEFWGYQLPKELTDCKTYTIEELCGEEEKCE